MAWAAFLLLSASAYAQPPETRPITSRNFRIDLHEAPVFGSPRLVAMGGANFAVGEGASGLFTNPAVAVVANTGAKGGVDVTAFFNSYVPVSGVDFNNNGNPESGPERSAVYAPGLLLRLGLWGLAINASYVRHEMAAGSEGRSRLGTRSIIPHLGVARSIPSLDIAVGIGVRGGLLNVYTSEQGDGLFTQLGASAELGSVWTPRDHNIRLALAGALPVYSGAIDTECDPNNCYGHILPKSAVVPWTAVLGSGWRWGPGKWNERRESQFRDERQLIVALDLVIVGPVKDAYSLSEFAAGRLQPSGRWVTASPRFGAEVEAIPGWLRLRAGTYFEPARYPGVSGREHATAGLQVRLFSFRLGGKERRVALSLAGDYARRYHNAGASLGLWD